MQVHPQPFLVKLVRLRREGTFGCRFVFIGRNEAQCCLVTTSDWHCLFFGVLHRTRCVILVVIFIVTVLPVFPSGFFCFIKDGVALSFS